MKRQFSSTEVLRSELAPASPAQMTADIARILTEAHSARAELVKTMRESGLGPIECRDLNLAAQRLETITMVAGSLHWRLERTEARRKKRTS